MVWIAPTVCAWVSPGVGVEIVGANIPLRYSVLPTHTPWEMGKGELLGSGSRTTCARAEVARPVDSVAAKRSVLAARETRFSSCIWSPLFDFSSDLVDGAVGRERGAFLPTDKVAGVVTSEVDTAVGFEETLNRRSPAAEAADPGTQVVRDHAPVDVDGFGEILA